MKKFFVIILLMVYSFTSFGFSLNYFYCCGKLKDITVATQGSHNKNCPMEMEGEKCCENRSVSVKLSSDQQNSLFQLFDFSLPALQAILPVTEYDLSVRPRSTTTPDFNNLPPPLLTERNILYHTFRI